MERQWEAERCFGAARNGKPVLADGDGEKHGNQ